ncbi:MAG: hypothetical protein DMF79_15075, partial [Acidobacteria bacterium]
MNALLSRLAHRYPMLFAIWEAVGMGLQGIRAYKMRAGLTILGVVMGIMTVIGMSSIVAGLNASMASQIQSLGASVVFVRPFAPGEHVSDEEWRKRKGLTPAEVAAIGTRPAVAEIAAMEFVPAEMVKYGNDKARDVRVFGVDQNYES